MTVTNLWSGLRMYSAFQSNNDTDSTETFAITSPGMREMVDIAALNSHVKFDKTDIPFEQRKILGDATETGLIRFAGKHIADYDEYQKQYPKVFEIPFNSSNKWALVIVSAPLSLSEDCIVDHGHSSTNLTRLVLSRHTSRALQSVFSQSARPT